MIDVLQQSVKSLMDDFRILNETIEQRPDNKKSFIQYFSKLFELQTIVEKDMPKFIKNLEQLPSSNGQPSPYELLYKSSLLLNSTLQIDELLNLAIDTIMKMTGAGRGFITTLNEAGSYQLVVSRNTDAADLEETKRELSDTIILRMIQKKETLAISKDVYDNDLLDKSSIIRLKSSQTICTPILIDQKLAAMIYLDEFTNITISKVELVKAFSNQMACVLRQSEIFGALKSENKRLLNELRNRYQFDHIIGRSSKMIDVLKLVSRVADTLATVQIQGESGTGKDLIARALHQNSSRANKQLIQVDCGALPENLIESELFVM
jgi:transcriptional regulator with GAF, ATPase, and Fis domain